MNLEKIQGNIVPGFSKDYQAFVFVRFGGADPARNWLATLQPELASATEVAGSAQATATWVNLALSFAGLRLLVGAGGVARFPATFRDNQPPGADPQLFGGEIHAVLILAADRSEDLDAELNRQRERLRTPDVAEITTVCGSTLPGDQRGHEHFGFKDAISQPRIAGTAWGVGPEVAAGEFVLGYPDESGQTSGANLPAWTQNGSFVAFVQLQQHVEAFWRAMQVSATSLGVPPADVAAWIVGRKTSGEQLSDPPARASHIGRAYSRWTTDAQRHRILRRGIPYGPPLAPDAPEDGLERGLCFLAYQADIERQFQHVWTRWLNSTDFPMPAAGRDALVGQTTVPNAGMPTGWSTKASRSAIAARSDLRGGTVNLNFSAFVTPRFGGYFFAPAVSEISQIGLVR